MKRSLSMALAVAAVAPTLTPRTAAANGLYSHAHISQLAEVALPPGELRDLLDDPEMRAAYEAGSIFPDSGYAVDSPYGEHAHWEPFLVAYIDHLRTTYGGDYSSRDAQRQVAFLLGVASHGMADQSYDTTLLLRAFEVDGPEPGMYPVDQYADYFIVVDQDVVFTVEAWAPYDDLTTVLDGTLGGIDAETLMAGMDRASTVTGLQSSALIAEAAYWDAWEHYPWLGTWIYEEVAVGSLPWLATLVAEYWQVLWKRLQDTDDPDEDLVLRTVPPDGGVNWPVSSDESVALSRIGVWLGYGVSTRDEGTRVTLRAADGTPVEVTRETAYGGDDRNLLFLRPASALDHDTEYVVEVAAGVTTLDGRVTTAPHSFSFRTRCAPDRLDDCPPLDPPLETGPIPTPDAGMPHSDAGVAADAGGEMPASGGSDEGCGCVAAGAAPARGSGVVATLAAALLVRRRQRRRSAS